MSALELFGRPYVVFNPANKDHRAYYYDFVQTASWGKCPVRFVVPEDHGDLITMIQRSLIKFYVEKEFRAGGRVRQKEVQKTSKTVDKRPKR
jgi:hypothetical protein